MTVTYRITTEHAARCAARRDVARCARLGVDPVAEVTRPPEVTIPPSLHAAYLSEGARFLAGHTHGDYDPPAIGEVDP